MINLSPKLIKEIQRFFKITVDGVYGPLTKKKVVSFQREELLVADGICGVKTLDAMGILDTDLRDSSLFKTDNVLTIYRHHLPKGEYVENMVGENAYVFLHHTAGNDNPYHVIDYWGRDTIGRIATEFVIGGQNYKHGKTDHDGHVVQAFPTGSQAWHLGRTLSKFMNTHSVGIELCSFGQVTDDNKVYTGTTIDPSQINTLEEAFKGYSRHHRYSNSQINSLKKLLIYIANRDSIDLREGLIKWIHAEGVTKAFDYHEDAAKGIVKGLLTHANVRKAKVDLFPQAEIIDMLLNI